MKTYRCSSFGLMLAMFWCAAARAADAPTGYQKRVAVSAPTRLDWTFAVSTRSLDKAPAEWLGDYDSMKQAYELYVPANYSAKQAYPVVLFVSAGDGPAGWGSFEKLCKEQGVIFASPLGAGNGVEPKKRVRVILDVLDDVRRKYRTDPDRTYIAGFSGGGRIACGIAFALPEYFGGVMGVCAAGDLRQESWLRHRVIDRLSVAFLTGETDFNRSELERWRGPILKEVGVRANVWVFPKMGHAIPNGDQLQEVFTWLEAGLKQRRDLAKAYPASRVPAEKPLTRAEWSAALLAEGTQKTKDATTLYAGLMLVQGVMHRWDGMPAAADAKKLLLELDARKEHPWEKDDIDEQRRFLIAQARGLADYATGSLPPQYAKERTEMAGEALKLWEIIQKDGQDVRATREAARRIPELKKLAGDKEK